VIATGKSLDYATKTSNDFVVEYVVLNIVFKNKFLCDPLKYICTYMIIKIYTVDTPLLSFSLRGTEDGQATGTATVTVNIGNVLEYSSAVLTV